MGFPGFSPCPVYTGGSVHPCVSYHAHDCQLVLFKRLLFLFPSRLPPSRCDPSQRSTPNRRRWWWRSPASLPAEAPFSLRVLDPACTIFFSSPPGSLAGFSSNRYLPNRFSSWLAGLARRLRCLFVFEVQTSPFLPRPGFVPFPFLCTGDAG